ncbi:DUF4873 domain-containing protein [Mycolicibacterium baixiangningiae]|uniref:DUF4873 domain-containing protein n=1 Tax=Mycolicibacterium baixiangningiae TaxID=2761578 RepID=UPI0018D13A96|nr:DUF4873 domain-containing protein [Mycolicibacterium baixiangningiae]
MSTTVFDVIAIGVPDAVRVLRDAGITAVAELPDPAAISRTFDDAEHTWSVQTAEDTVRGRIVVSAEAPGGPLPAYLGVAAHRFPNHFTISGPGRIRVHRWRYVVGCLHVMAEAQATRIEVRHRTQRTADARERTGRWYWRRMRRQIPSVFDLDSQIGVEDEVYDGPALVTLAGSTQIRRVRLSGHLDPVDGRYHWRGTVFGELPTRRHTEPVTVAVDGSSAEGRIGEPTPWGHAIAGVGAPPFPVDDVVVHVPAR